MAKTIDILYQRYLRGELSAEELEEFRQLVAETADDDLWDLMCLDFVNASEATQMPFDAKQRVFENIERETQTQRKSFKLRYVAAAIVLLFVMIGGYTWYAMSNATVRHYATITVKPGQKASAVLPDGTRIDLNGGTKLCYDVVPGEHREVILNSGEAFFDVAKDANCPFQVRVKGMQVEVLGTRFNVKTTRERVETALFSGAVRLTANNLNRPYRMKPGQKAVYTASTAVLKWMPNDLHRDAGWKEGYLVFSSTPLNDVLQQIANWYGVQLQLARPRIGGDLLTGSFYNETLESVLHSLSMQYGFTYRKQGDKIIVE